MARHKDGRSGWLFVSPALLHLGVFALFPIGYAIWLSFHDWKILRGDRKFVGLENYQQLFGDGSFWNALLNSLEYTALSVPIGTAVALLIALLVAQPLRGMAFFRTLFYIPAVSSGVAVSMMWLYVYLPERGLINSVAAVFGQPSIDFLNDSAWAMPALVFMSIWTGLGPRMVVFLAGLVGIPPALYEAASLDGATSSRQFWKITLPMLIPTTMFVVITSTIAALQLFTPIYMLTKGGPEDRTDMVGYHIYQEAWVKFDIGSAAAQSFVLLLVVALISFFQVRLMNRRLDGWSSV